MKIKKKHLKDVEAFCEEYKSEIPILGLYKTARDLENAIKMNDGNAYLQLAAALDAEDPARKEYSKKALKYGSSILYNDMSERRNMFFYSLLDFMDQNVIHKTIIDVGFHAFAYCLTHCKSLKPIKMINTLKKTLSGKTWLLELSYLEHIDDPPKVIRYLAKLLQQIHYKSEIDLDKRTIEITFGSPKNVMAFYHHGFKEFWKEATFSKLVELCTREFDYIAPTKCDAFKDDKAVISDDNTSGSISSFKATKFDKFYDLIHLVKYFEIDKVIDLDPCEMYDIRMELKQLNQSNNNYQPEAIELLGCYVKRSKGAEDLRVIRKYVTMGMMTEEDANVIFICYDNIHYFCDRFDLYEYNIKSLVCWHEFGHLCFSYTNPDERKTEDEKRKIEEQQANWFASYYFGGLKDADISNKTMHLPKEYHDPILFSDYMNNRITIATIDSLYKGGK